MVERVLVQEVAFVEKEDWVDAVAAEVLHVGRDRVEDGGGGGRRLEAERDAELAVDRPVGEIVIGPFGPKTVSAERSA